MQQLRDVPENYLVARTGTMLSGDYCAESHAEPNRLRLMGKQLARQRQPRS